MNIHEFLYRIKAKLGKAGSVETVQLDEAGQPARLPWLRKFFLSAVIILVALASFGLGRLSLIGNREPIQISYENLDGNDQISMTNDQSNSLDISHSSLDISQAVYASSKGSRYYYSWCKSTISEKNRVSFATAALAEKAGYTLAANCQPK